MKIVNSYSIITTDRETPIVVIVKSNLPCSCKTVDKTYKCKKCRTDFCLNCQSAYLVSVGFFERHQKIRICPECHSDNLEMLDETKLNIKLDQEYSQVVISRPSDVSSYD